MLCPGNLSALATQDFGAGYKASREASREAGLELSAMGGFLELETRQELSLWAAHDSATCEELKAVFEQVTGQFSKLRSGQKACIPQNACPAGWPDHTHQLPASTLPCWQGTPVLQLDL